MPNPTFGSFFEADIDIHDVSIFLSMKDKWSKKVYAPNMEFSLDIEKIVEDSNSYDELIVRIREYCND